MILIKRLPSLKEGKSLLYWNLCYDFLPFLFTSSFLSPPLNQRMTENWSEEWGDRYVCIIRVWLKERQMFTKVAILHWFILWRERAWSERMAAYSRKGQRPIELNECNQEKAKLLKGVKFSTNSKTYKCNFILRGQVQGYWMSFTKEEVLVRGSADSSTSILRA